jgi:hypothetical protein
MPREECAPEGRLLQKLTSSASALPPDVRRRLCPAETGQIIPGYAPGSGLALQIYWAKGRTKGIAQKWKGNLYGGA